MTEAEQQTRALDLGHQLKLMTYVDQILTWASLYINERIILNALADRLEKYAALFRERARDLEQD